MSRVMVSEFKMKGLDRAARLAGEAFGFDDSAAESPAQRQDITTSAHLWLAAAVVALVGFIFLVQ